jgi:F-type H+-transporting ATPase subunit gamma
MANLKDIRKRIDSVENTKKITRAMKMVATAKLRRAEEAMKSSRPYAREIRRVIASLADRVEEEAHPLLEQRELPDNALIIVVSTDRGLCGSYNANLFREIDDFIKTHEVADEQIDIANIGEKGLLNFRRHETVEVVRNYEGVIGDVDYDGARAIAQDGIAAFKSGQYDNIYLAYNEFVSAIQYEQVIEPFLPISIDGLVDEDDIDDKAGLDTDYIYEPDEVSLLDYALPRHLEVQVLQALLESAAAEQAARMTAMDNATENAEEMIEDLTLEFNRARQAAITNEIMEIVSGAEAME